MRLISNFNRLVKLRSVLPEAYASMLLLASPVMSSQEISQEKRSVFFTSDTRSCLSLRTWTCRLVLDRVEARSLSIFRLDLDSFAYEDSP